MNIFLSLQSTPIYILKQQRIKYKSPRFKRALISPSLESRSFSLFTLSAVNLVILVLQDKTPTGAVHYTTEFNIADFRLHAVSKTTSAKMNLQEVYILVHLAHGTCKTVTYY